MTLEFKNYFSDDSKGYQQFRTQYPKALFEYLASLTQKHDTAWDYATSTGQAAIALSNYYSTVFATDASQSQLETAAKKKGILHRLIGYLNTWSAVKKYQSDTGNNPLEKLYDKILKRWGDPDQGLAVAWPLAVRIWRKE